MTNVSMADILGDRYLKHSYPIRARMPSGDFNFVSRVIGIDGQYGKYEPCSIEIEYDSPVDSKFVQHNTPVVCPLAESSHVGISTTGLYWY